MIRLCTIQFILVTLAVGFLSTSCSSDGPGFGKVQKLQMVAKPGESVPATEVVSDPKAPLAGLADQKTEEKLLTTDIETVARRADQSLEEYWICNRNARVLKTGYAAVKPEVKAKFAIAYQKMVDASGQNLAADLNTYLPYSKRAEFALKWWRESEYKDAFEKENKKKKVQWIYESMLDASELYWRAFETRHTNLVNSGAVLAHDKEQDMVFNYMENEQTPSSFSEQYTKWSDKEL